LEQELVLTLNEITALMAISSVGIMALMGMMVHLSITSIFAGDSKKTAAATIW
jgi:predicted RecA/RadA family phage recombinase